MLLRLLTLIHFRESDGLTASPALAGCYRGTCNNPRSIVITPVPLSPKFFALEIPL